MSPKSQFHNSLKINKLLTNFNIKKLVKSLMVNLYFAKRFFCASGIAPNLTFNAKLVNVLFGYKAAAS